MRIAWLDSIRVLATLLVILSHYIYTIIDVPAVQNFLRTYLVAIGSFGVSLFFAISGYLAANSLEHSTSILEFYRRKFIRITVPYATAYILIGAAFLVVKLFFPSLSSGTASKFPEKFQPLGILLSILPIDVNLIKFFNLPSYHIVGEWFIGTVVFMYIIAPFLYKCVKINSLATSAAAVAISIFAFHETLPLVEQQLINTNLWLFIVRIPEFLAGMILFIYQDSILNYKNNLAKVLIALIILVGIFYLKVDMNFGSIWQQLFSGYSLRFIIAAVSTIYLTYFITSYLNDIFPRALNRFNNFSNISYVAMLIHHIIISQFSRRFDFSNLNELQVIIFFIMILVSTILASEILRKIYKPVENKLIKRGD